MRVPHELQVRLLDLQRVETEQSQAARRLATAATLRRTQELEATVARLESESITVRTESEDLARAISRAEQDLDRVRERRQRDTEMIGSGVNARMQSELEHEVQSLRRRIGDLEDAELELMEQQEQLEQRGQAIADDLASAREESARVRAEWDAERRELQERTASLGAERESVLRELPPDLVRTYEGAKNTSGVGGARFADGQCQGCRLFIPPAEAAELMAAPADELQFCEECGCILVRDA